MKSLTVDEAFVARLLKKDRATIARAISIAEIGNDDATGLLNKLYPYLGNARRIGITGPPGAGKSTITAELARQLREHNKSVAIIAVDPSSPLTQGAVLGDRVRMVELEDDDEVFIRSMATRGVSGGLSAKTFDAADILDAAGFSYIILESVGTGQIDLKIQKYVDTTIAVLVPESGDQVQAIKAGLMEIADIYVLNKSDRDGSANVLHILKSALSFHSQRQWSPPVVRSVATKGEGIAEIFQQIEKHHACLSTGGQLQAMRNEGVKMRIYDMVNEIVSAALWENGGEQRIADAMPGILQGKITPKQLAVKIAGEFMQEKNFK